MKKLLLTLSAPVVAITPIVATIACGNSTKNEEQNLEDVKKALTEVRDYSTSIDLSNLQESTFENLKGEILEELDLPKDNGVKYEIKFLEINSANKKLKINVIATKNGVKMVKVITITWGKIISPDQKDVNALISRMNENLIKSEDSSTLNETDFDKVDFASLQKENFHSKVGVTAWTIENITLNGCELSFAKTPENGAIAGKKYTITITITKGDASGTIVLIARSKDYDNRTQDEKDVADASSKYVLPTKLVGEKNIEDLDTIVEATKNDFAIFDGAAITSLGIIASSTSGVEDVALTYKLTSKPKENNKHAKYTLRIKFSKNRENKERDFEIVSSDVVPDYKGDIEAIISSIGAITQKTSDKSDIKTLLGLVSETYNELDDNAKTELNLETENIWPATPNGVDIKYKLQISEFENGETAEFSLDIQFSKGSNISNWKTINVVLTSSDTVSDEHEISLIEKDLEKTFAGEIDSTKTSDKINLAKDAEDTLTSFTELVDLIGYGGTKTINLRGAELKYKVDEVTEADEDTEIDMPFVIYDITLTVEKGNETASVPITLNSKDVVTGLYKTAKKIEGMLSNPIDSTLKSTEKIFTGNADPDLTAGNFNELALELGIKNESESWSKDYDDALLFDPNVASNSYDVTFKIESVIDGDGNPGSPVKILTVTITLEHDKSSISTKLILHSADKN